MSVAAQYRWPPGAWHGITLVEAARYLNQIRLAEQWRRSALPRA